MRKKKITSNQKNMMHQVCQYFKIKSNVMNNKIFNKNMQKMKKMNSKDKKKKIKLPNSHKITRTFNRHKINKAIKVYH